MNVPLVYLPLGLLLLLMLTVGGISFIRRRRRRRATAQQPQPATCRCGYPLDNLDAARCPECGRVLGFDATADDLGLTLEELQRAQAQRQRRDAERA